MYVTVFQLCDVRPELFQYMWLFITGINMYEYYQQLWYLKKEVLVSRKLLQIYAFNMINSLLLKTCLR